MPSLIRQDTALAGSDTAASSVEWYLIVWILLTLASNSMAQPSGRISGASSRYRIYLCSSPLFCFADSLAILVRVITTTVYLQISPVKACRLAIISRADERHHSKRNKDTEFDDLFPSAAEQAYAPVINTAATWPRWLFFLVGTAPATIELASFSGVPWTQTAGFMFISSFVVIEIITLISSFKSEEKTIPEVLGYVKFEGVPLKEQGLRFKVFELVKRLQWFETFIFVTVLILHLMLVFVLAAEVFHHIYIPLTAYIAKVYQHTWARIAYDTYTSISSLLTIMRFLLWLVGFIKPWPALDNRFPMFTWAVYMLLLGGLFVPSPRDKPIPADQKQGLQDKTRVIFAGAFATYCMFPAIGWICKRWPRLSEGLLVERRVWDSKKTEHLSDYFKTGVELETGVLHSSAWLSFCVFVVNLVVCVLWYALVYDDTGTLNPSWTYVFG